MTLTWKPVYTKTRILNGC